MIIINIQVISYQANSTQTGTYSSRKDFAKNIPGDIIRLIDVLRQAIHKQFTARPHFAGKNTRKLIISKTLIIKLDLNKCKKLTLLKSTMIKRKILMI